MSGVRQLKRGEFLFKEADKIQTVFIVQSGQLSIQVQKNRKNVELMTVSTGYVFADHIVLGIGQYSFSAMATQETKIVEIPVDSFKQQYDAIHQIYRSFIKSCCERLKWTLTEIKNKKTDKDAIPCGPEEIPRVFGIVYHVLKHKGTLEGESCRIDWTTLRQYAQRIFGESMKRIDQVTQILVKLKLAEYIYTPKENEDDASKPEISALKIHDLLALENFFEFYQYYYYKGNKQEILRPDDINFNVLNILLMAYESVSPDKSGVVSKDFNEVTDFFKEYGISFGSGQLTSLETKGLFCKRKPVADNKVLLQFELKEFRNLLNTWRLIKEVDKWNEKSFVDIFEVEESPRKKMMQIEGGVECGTCHHVMAAAAKFCAECGAKIEPVNVTDAAKGGERKAA